MNLRYAGFCHNCKNRAYLFVSERSCEVHKDAIFNFMYFDMFSFVQNLKVSVKNIMWISTVFERQAFDLIPNRPIQSLSQLKWDKNLHLFNNFVWIKSHLMFLSNYFAHKSVSLCLSCLPACLPVCLSVYLYVSSCISKTTRRTSSNFQCMLTVAKARSCNFSAAGRLQQSTHIASDGYANSIAAASMFWYLLWPTAQWGH